MCTISSSRAISNSPMVQVEPHLGNLPTTPFAIKPVVEIMSQYLSEMSNINNLRFFSELPPLTHFSPIKDLDHLLFAGHHLDKINFLFETAIIAGNIDRNPILQDQAILQTALQATYKYDVLLANILSLYAKMTATVNIKKCRQICVLHNKPIKECPDVNEAYGCPNYEDKPEVTERMGVHYRTIVFEKTLKEIIEKNFHHSIKRIALSSDLMSIIKRNHYIFPSFVRHAFRQPGGREQMLKTVALSRDALDFFNSIHWVPIQVSQTKPGAATTPEQERESTKLNEDAMRSLFKLGAIFTKKYLSLRIKDLCLGLFKHKDNPFDISTIRSLATQSDAFKTMLSIVMHRGEDRERELENQMFAEQHDEMATVSTPEEEHKESSVHSLTQPTV